jgi:hypothetical protein
MCKASSDKIRVIATLALLSSAPWVEQEPIVVLHGAKESSATVATCGIVSDDNFATLNWPQRLARVFPSGITLI